VLDDQRQLIRRLVSNDRAAADEFFNEWNDRITYWVSGRAAGNKVEEYAQEIWLHLMQGNWLRLLQWRPLYDDEAWHPHSLEGFLKTITQNKVFDLIDAEPPVLPAGLDPADIVDRSTPLGNDPLLEAERSRLMSAYEECASHFQPKDHLALMLWWQGHDAKTIARKVGGTPNNVYQRRSYLLKCLREGLAERLPEYFRHD
jgi:DNA-directed RNA polymerase specialized sigma24 family protein